MVDGELWISVDMIHVAHVSSSYLGPSGSEDKYQSLGTEGMSSKDLTFGMIFLLQTTFGILGNFFLLFQYIILCFTKCRLRSTDLILKHLTVANSLSILCKGIPKTMEGFGWKNFLNDVGCKFVLYGHRVGRGVSFGSTCLLSIFQAIIISPRNSGWAELQVKAPKYMGFSIFLSWILHMLLNTSFLMYMTSNRSNKSITNKKDYGYCSSVRIDQTTILLNSLWLALPDVVTLGLMLWFSGSMVFILYKHKQRVQHIHRNSVSPRASAETRATQTILVLVSTFVSFYILSSIFQIFIAVFYQPSWWILNMDALISMCFPTVSPLILMSCDSSLSRLCFDVMKKTKFPPLIRNT
nr:vomeronasal type-1 receptor 4-like [Loxodonta africana]